jgi:ADP-ribose pyrophosphatase YjhB (NUDIX family)/predicted ABC-type ATPase
VCGEFQASEDLMDIITNSETDSTVEVKNVGVSRRLRPTDPDVFSNPDSARVRARQLGCIGIRRYDSQAGGYVWMPCTNESDYRRQMGTSHSGRLQRRREIQTEIRRFVRGKALEEMDEKSGAYTKPELRNRIKNRIMAGSKGGRPGQWSARKAQLLAQAYRKAGGGYKGGKDKRQRSLSRWTSQDWTTSDGKPANRSGGMRRYLPRAAWSRLSPGQIRATNRKKIQGSRSGSQFVRNTETAMNAARSARKQLNELMFDQKALGATIGSTRRSLRGAAARFDPNARDADLDRMVQEGTIFERPDTPDKPEMNVPAVRRMVAPQKQTVARRMQRIDSGTGLVAAMTDDKKKKKRKPKTSSILLRSGQTQIAGSVEGGVPIQKGYKGNPGPLPESGTEELLDVLVERGLFFIRQAKGDHKLYGMDFRKPDGTVERREISVYPKLTMRLLRDESIRRGILPQEATGLKPGKIAEVLLGSSNLKGEQKDAVTQAFRELTEDDTKPFPGFRALERRAQEIAQAPIPLDEIRNFVKSQRSGTLNRSYVRSQERGYELDAKAKKLGNVKRLSEPEQMEWKLWKAAQDSDADPINSLSTYQLESLQAQLNGLAADYSLSKDIKSDTDLVEDFGPIGFYGVQDARANLPKDILRRITNPSREKNPEFYPFASWRKEQIEKGDYTPNIEQAEEKLGGLSGMMRGDGSRRFSRRYYRADGLSGAMTGDERKSDFSRKQRIWQSDILARVLQHNQAEALRRQGMTPEQLAQEPALPFPNWTEQFGTLDVATITGAPGVTSFSHKVVDLLYKRLEREWGANESQIFGEKPTFKIWDAPMSRLDIENLAANKRTIVGTFIDEAKKLDPNSPFAQFDPATMPDSDVDMLWRSYVIPELLKQPGTSMMPMDNIPFEIDPTKEELIRNYNEYLELKKLGLQTDMSQEDFDAGMAELLGSTSKDFEDFVGELNKAYDEYKETGQLPGQFTDESLINPETGNIFTEQEWRQFFDQAGEEMMEKTSKFNEAAQELAVAQGLYAFLWQVGMQLGYLKPEDVDNMNDDAEDAIEEMDEIDPLPDLDPKDLTFDFSARTKLAQDDSFGWMWRRFVENAKNWAYPLAEQFHPYDIQQHRYMRPDFIKGRDQYAAPATEQVDLANLDWDKLLELIEAGSHVDDIDLPGVKSIIAKSREARAKKLSADKKKYIDSKSAAAQAERDKIWAMFDTDGLTAREIAAKLDISGSVVDRVLKNESKSRGLTRQQYRAIERKAEAGSDAREEQFKTDLFNTEVQRIRDITKGSPESYLEKLQEARQYYKDVEKQANASYSQARRRYAELATLANMLLMDLPDGRQWDPTKESAAAFKNRWLKRMNEIYPALVRIAGQVDAMQWSSDDRVSASSRVLQRSKSMISQIDEEIARVKAVQGISDIEDLRQRHNIQAISAVKDLARKAVRGQYPNMTDEEIDKLFEDTGDGLIGGLSGAIRGASRGKKARELFDYSGRNSGEKRGFLRRLADAMPDMRHNDFVTRMAEWLDGLEDQFSSPRMRARRVTGDAPVSSRAQLRARRTLNGILNANQDDFGLARSARERQTIRGLSRSAKKAKINVRRYFDGRDDDEDVKWSSNDWSYAKVNPIRGADVVVYRRNPNEKDPLKAIEVLVIGRKSGPFTGARALPGGLNDEGETLVETAMREMKEEVGISSEGMRVRNLGIIQSRDWDPRFVEGVTVQGMAVNVPFTTEAVAGSDAKKAQFVPLSEILGGDGHIAFGHASFMKEALKNEAPAIAEKLEIHERAGRVRNRRLIQKINANRSAAGQKLFPIASDDEVEQVFDLIRPSDPRYKDLNDPAAGLTGALSQRYDIKQNPDGTFDIVDTQNNNARVAGPFKSRKQAVYGAIRKDRDPSFNPQMLLGRRRKKAGAKPAKRKRQQQVEQVVPAAPQPEQLSLDFGDNQTTSRLDQSKDGLTGAITSAELLSELGITLAPSTMSQTDLNRGIGTSSGYYARNVFDQATGKNVDVTRARFDSLWVPYRDAVQSIVPDSEKRSQPILYIIGGPSGSLKSTIRESGLAGIPSRREAITIDPDEGKLVTPEYITLAAAGDRNAANLVHEESKAMAINALEAAVAQNEADMRVMKQGKDIVYDSLGQLQDSEIQAAIQKLRAAGYKVVGYYFFADDNTAAKRMRERARKTNRKVPAGLYSQSINGIQQRIGQSLRSRDTFDEIVFFDTSDASNIQRAAVYIADPANATPLLSANPPSGSVVRNMAGTTGQLTIEPITPPAGTTGHWTGDSFLVGLLNLRRFTSH